MSSAIERTAVVLVGEGERAVAWQEGVMTGLAEAGVDLRGGRIIRAAGPTDTHKLSDDAGGLDRVVIVAALQGEEWEAALGDALRRLDARDVETYVVRAGDYEVDQGAGRQAGFDVGPALHAVLVLAGAVHTVGAAAGGSPGMYLQPFEAARTYTVPNERIVG